MNDISRAMEKKRAEKAKHRYAVGAESGADWGLTLIYQALHDKYGFREKPVRKLNAAWEHLDSKEHGFSIRWRDELCAISGSTASSMSVTPSAWNGSSQARRRTGVCGNT